ncbi:transglutaminase domain-containing protein [Campylobacter sp. MOP7]|uniref:transglutaminase domain-containing protein n=1 Tax=Campylobacter canis TaxID=3378588 RepID=UPI00387E44D5
MQRRDFFKFSAVVGAASFAPNVVLANSEAIKTPNKNRIFDVSLKHSLKEQGKLSRLWVPLLVGNEYQQLVSNYDVSTNAKEYYISDLVIPTLYAGFNENEKDANLELKFRVRTQERNTDFSKVNFNENEKLSPEVEFFLKPTKQIPNTGIVKQKAEEIVKGINGDLEKAKAIYTWVANTMERDNSVIGCGLGDVKAILESGKLVGKCTDINSVFVGLCRAVGIPARELFGIRVGQSRFSKEMGKADENGLAKISGGQHCRAEFYLKGYGWIPVDPADVTKVRLGEKLSNSDERLSKIREYLFGNWEMCWVGFNYGRDFILKPEPEQIPLNNFGYPYAETDGNTANYYSPKEFSYDYTAQELKA